MTFLPQQNQRVAGEPRARGRDHRHGQARDRHRRRRHGQRLHRHLARQGGKSVTQLEISRCPPEKENKALWAYRPKLRVSSSQARAPSRVLISTTGFAGSNGKVEKLLYAASTSRSPVPGSEAVVGRSGAVRHGLLGTGGERLVNELELPVVPRGRFKGLDANERDYRVGAAQGVCRRRHPSRSIACRVGHPRGPAGCARHRSLPDGPQRPAAVGLDARNQATMDKA